MYGGEFQKVLRETTSESAQRCDLCKHTIPAQEMHYVEKMKDMEIKQNRFYSGRHYCLDCYNKAISDLEKKSPS